MQKFNVSVVLADDTKFSHRVNTEELRDMLLRWLETDEADTFLITRVSE